MRSDRPGGSVCDAADRERALHPDAAEPRDAGSRLSPREQPRCRSGASAGIGLAIAALVLNCFARVRAILGVEAASVSPNGPLSIRAAASTACRSRDTRGEGSQDAGPAPTGSARLLHDRRIALVAGRDLRARMRRARNESPSSTRRWRGTISRRGRGRTPVQVQQERVRDRRRRNRRQVCRPSRTAAPRGHFLVIQMPAGFSTVEIRTSAPDHDRRRRSAFGDPRHRSQAPPAIMTPPSGWTASCSGNGWSRARPGSSAR